VVTDTIEIRGTLTLSDLIRFQYFNVLRLAWPLFLLGVPIMLLNVLMFFLGGDWTSKGRQMLPFSAWVLFLLLLPPISAKWQLSTQRYLSEEVTYSFGAEGVRLVAPSFSTSMTWPIFRAIRETKSAFLLYSAPQVAYIVPKKFFTSKPELVAWRHAVGAWIAPRSIRTSAFGRWC
jgi:hypothetical protein